MMTLLPAERLFDFLAAVEAVRARFEGDPFFFKDFIQFSII
jgi:hypothetical protein